MPAESWTLTNSAEMDEEQFHLWQALLEDRTGMQMPTQRKRFLETSISMRMREIGCEAYDQYYEQLVSGPNGPVEWITLVDRLTVQETRFFRHPSSYQLVFDYCRERMSKMDQSSFNIWSVGCATGEETYSLGMQIDEAFAGSFMKTYFGITGTDISLPALSKARKGIYSLSKIDGVSDERREKFFTEISPGQFQVKEELRERICFASINVQDLGAAPLHDLDIIFCQNLLIYFRRWRKRQIVNNLAERLKPGGLMVLGVGEFVENIPPELEKLDVNNTLAFTRRA